MERKKQVVLEVLGFIILLMGINLLFFRADLGFHEFNPNPLWLVVIFISARYGANWGIVSSLLVSLIYLLTIGKGEEQIAAGVPMVVSFVIIGFFLGGLRDSLGRKLQEWHEKSQRQEEELESINSRYAALDDLRKELEKKILTQTATVVTLYETARNLDNLELEVLLPIIPRVVNDYIGSECCSIYLIEGDNFRLRAASGYSTDSVPPERVSISEGIMGKVAVLEEIITIHDPEEIENGKVNGGALGRIMCAPLKSVSGKVIGVINIDRLPFVKFNRASVKLLSVVAEWASRAIENAKRYGKAEANRIDDEITKAYNAAYMKRRLNDEMQKATRYKSLFSIMLVKIDDYALIASEEMRGNVLGALGSSFSAALRTTDMVGRGEESGSFLMILPFTNEEGSVTVEKRLAKSINDFELKPYRDAASKLRFSIGRAEFNPKFKTSQGLLDEARKNMQSD